MESRSGNRSYEAWERLLRRAHIVVEHHQYRRQPVDVRDVVRRVLAAHPSGLGEVVHYRAPLEEAVESLVRGFR